MVAHIYLLGLIFISHLIAAARSSCPTGKKCIVITNSNVYMNFREIELYQGSTKIDKSSISISMSTVEGSGAASNCNDGVTDSSDHHKCCVTGNGANQWIMAATTDNFSRAFIYNRLGGDAARANSGSLVFMDGSNITTSAVSFSSKGTSLATYTFCASGFNGTLCDTCSTGYTASGLGSTLRCSITIADTIRIFNSSNNLYRDFLFIDDL